MKLTPLDYVYLVALAMLVVGEVIAVISHDPRRPTISSRIIRWMEMHYWRRWLIGFLLAWFCYHILLQ